MLEDGNGVRLSNVRKVNVCVCVCMRACVHACVHTYECMCRMYV